MTPEERAMFHAHLRRTVLSGVMNTFLRDHGLSHDYDMPVAVLVGSKSEALTFQRHCTILSTQGCLASVFLMDLSHLISAGEMEVLVFAASGPPALLAEAKREIQTELPSLTVQV